MKQTPKTSSLVRPRFSLTDGPTGEEIGLRCKSGLFQEHPIADSRGGATDLLSGGFQPAAPPAFSQSLQGIAATVLKMRP
jgi:hypothetical protein